MNNDKRRPRGPFDGVRFTIVNRESSRNEHNLGHSLHFFIFLRKIGPKTPARFVVFSRIPQDYILIPKKLLESIGIRSQDP
jgi:hypothetical protein